jgi:hypothetical protein
MAMIGWDGALPLIAAGAPWLVKAVFPKGHVAEIVAGLLVPIGTAVLRAAVGRDQIERRCKGAAPWGRQVALAVAIMTLLLFEVCSAGLVFAGNAPPVAWLAPLGFYLCYLVMISVALRSARQPLAQNHAAFH